MTLEAPATDLDNRFSSPGAVALPWTEAEQQLQKAGVYWLSTMRPEGRPHATPLFAVWLDGTLYFCTGDAERKAKNLAERVWVTITTGHNTLSDGLDLVVEGEAVVLNDGAGVRRVADAYAAKYGEGWRIAGADGVVTFQVTPPTTAFGFGRGTRRVRPRVEGSTRHAGASGPVRRPLDGIANSRHHDIKRRHRRRQAIAVGWLLATRMGVPAADALRGRARPSSPQPAR